MFWSRGYTLRSLSGDLIVCMPTAIRPCAFSYRHARADLISLRCGDLPGKPGICQSQDAEDDVTIEYTPHFHHRTATAQSNRLPLRRFHLNQEVC